MRLHEIEEELPGKVGTLGKIGAIFGLGGAAANAAKLLRDKAKIAYKQWLGAQAQIRAGGLDLDDQEVFANAFGQYIAKNFRLKSTDEIISSAVDAIKRVPKVEHDFMIDLIVKMMGQYRTRNAGVTGKTTGPAPTTPVVVPLDAGPLGKWTWDGKQWIDASGDPARGMRPDQLNKIATEKGYEK